MMLSLVLLSLSVLAASPAPSPVEGAVKEEYIPEGEMMQGLLESLARFSQYMAGDYQPCAVPNRRGEPCGCFRGMRTMTSSEDGVRTNADLSMLCAFLAKYGAEAGVSLPPGVSYGLLEKMAKESLVYAYSTHKAVRLRKCSGGDYWGSTGTKDAVWESSLWAFSVAWSAYLQWDRLSGNQRRSIYVLLKAECDYELQRNAPTRYEQDTRAEENGWDVCVLAAALGLFPDDPLAPRWFQKMREFAVNSYSHPGDRQFREPLDPWYDNHSVADFYRGPNLFEDYTLQNHRFFHTSYQNVVMQELGEAALALACFQTGLGKEEKWRSRSLFHNLAAVQERVLDELALPDGDLAMPNGNDWSLFLFDQITSYSTLATFLRDPDALMLENLAYKNLLARQSTTSDGSWLLRPDIGARRMGVQGHRVMMTYLMHRSRPVRDVLPTRWEDFRARHSRAKLFPCQDVVRAFSPARFVSFSYSRGLQNYSGMIASNTPDRNKVFVPFRHGGTGNFIGWYEVEGKKEDAVMATEPYFDLKGDSFVTGCTLVTNEGVLETRFSLYATEGNAVIYLDRTTARKDVTVTAERGLTAGVSMDEFTAVRRTVSWGGVRPSSETTDGEGCLLLDGSWANVDGEIGLVTRGGGSIAFGDRADNNSIYTAKLYGSFSTARRKASRGDRLGDRAGVYYSGVSPEQTARLDRKTVLLAEGRNLPAGWAGCLTMDPDGETYLLTAHFSGEDSCATVSLDIDLNQYPGVPVFGQEVLVHKGDRSGLCRGESRVRLSGGTASGQSSRFFVQGDGVGARVDASRPDVLMLRCQGAGTRAIVRYMTDTGRILQKEVQVGKEGKAVRMDPEGNRLSVCTETWP